MMQVEMSLLFYWTGIVAIIFQAWLTFASHSVIRYVEKSAETSDLILTYHIENSATNFSRRHTFSLPPCSF